MKVIIPFAVPAMVLLDIPDFGRDAVTGEITFRLGTIASAIGNKDHNSFARGVE